MRNTWRQASLRFSRFSVGFQQPQQVLYNLACYSLRESGDYITLHYIGSLQLYWL